MQIEERGVPQGRSCTDLTASCRTRWIRRTVVSRRDEGPVVFQLEYAYWPYPYEGEGLRQEDQVWSDPTLEILNRINGVSDFLRSGGREDFRADMISR